MVYEEALTWLHSQWETDYCCKETDYVSCPVFEKRAGNQIFSCLYIWTELLMQDISTSLITAL